MKTFASHLFLSAVAALGLAACVDPPDDSGVSASALEEENGGLTTADEAPMFGDEAAFEGAALEADADVADPMSSDETVATYFALPDALRARVAIVWGQLPPDLDNDEHVVDWSGSISVSRGALIVRHRIGFEPATDRLLPRTDRASVSFDSVTKPFADGLVLEVVDPTPDAADPITLTYARDAGGSSTIALADLLAGPNVESVDDQGDKIVTMALRDHGPCNHGFARGRWHAVRDGLGGLLGVVADGDGNPIGHIRGIWGQRASGEQVFFGKYIDADGTFQGIFAGHYRDGHMVGRWLDASGDHGRLEGRYEESAPGPRVGGHFMLRWAETSCAQDLPSDG